LIAVLMPGPKSKKTTPMRVPTISIGDMAERSRSNSTGAQENKKPAKSEEPVQPQFAKMAPVSPAEFTLLRDRYGRTDPFEPLYVIEEKVFEEIVELPEINPLPPMILRNPPNLVLSAIALREGEGFAIINGEILRVGDYVEDFAVNKIEKDSVELYNDMGDRAILRIKQEYKGAFDTSNGTLSNINVEPELLPAAKRKLQKLDLPPVTDFTPGNYDYHDDVIDITISPETGR